MAVSLKKFMVENGCVENTPVKNFLAHFQGEHSQRKLDNWTVSKPLTLKIMIRDFLQKNRNFKAKNEL